MMKVAPWNKIQTGDTVYFKDAGKEVAAKAEVKSVMQFDHYSQDQLQNILNNY
ncbi:MAG: hypothetical protein WCP92_04760 [bacterium]